jgi:hypothetical protein
VRFKDLTAVLLKILVFRDGTLCHWTKSFKGLSSKPRTWTELELLYPEDDDTNVLRNFVNYSPNNTE